MEHDPAMRRLPVYLVLDCCAGMAGEPIEAIRQGMNTLLGELRSDPQALETVSLSVITFDSSARQVVPLTELSLGAALTLLQDCIEKEVRKSTTEQKGAGGP